MGPVVACSTLQWLPRTHRLANGLLSLAIKLDSLSHHLLLHAFLFLVTLSLFPGVVLGRLHEVVLGP